jgi:hypothetical protein
VADISCVITLDAMGPRMTAGPESVNEGGGEE